MTRPHDSDLCDVADTVAELVLQELGKSVIPLVIPAHIGDRIRESARWQVTRWTHMVSLAGADALRMEYTLSPDGSLPLEMQEANGTRFWHGTFRPAGA